MIKFSPGNFIDLPIILQLGTELHPLCRQVITSSPCSMYPSLHETATVELKVVPSATEAFPLVGVGSPQSENNIFKL